MKVVSRPLARRRLYDDLKCGSNMRFVAAHDSDHLEITSQNFESTPAKSKSAAVVSSRPRFHAPLPIRMWHLASLDAPTVALIWSVAFAWVMKVHLPWWTLLLLSLGVWGVYVADRLLDARTSMHTSAPEKLHERHIFHWRHRRILAPAAIACGFISAWIVFQRMPSTTKEHDSLLAAASVLYFTRVHTGRKFLPIFPKELVVGLLFTLGCALPAFSRAHLSLAEWPLLISIGFYALLAWLNCLAIDRWESHDLEPSRCPIAFPAMVFSAAALICSSLLFASHPRSASLILCGAIAALLLAALDRVRSRITPVTLRAAADLALLTPALLLVLSPFFSR
jgi:hypothetical protein